MVEAGRNCVDTSSKLGEPAHIWPSAAYRSIEPSPDVPEPAQTRAPLVESSPSLVAPGQILAKVASCLVEVDQTLAHAVVNTGFARFDARAGASRIGQAIKAERSATPQMYTAHVAEHSFIGRVSRSGADSGLHLAEHSRSAETVGLRKKVARRDPIVIASRANRTPRGPNCREMGSACKEPGED